MKNISEISITSNSRNGHDLNNQINEQVKELVDTVFFQLSSIKPAWKTAWRGANDKETARNISLAKREWVKSFYENNINSVELVKNGLVAARRCKSDFIPSCGKFVGWCKNSEDHTESFHRFINRQKPQSYEERLTRYKCGYDCRRLSQEKSQKLWAKTFQSVVDGLRGGTIKRVDFDTPQIESPEKMKPTREQRNQQLDRQIAEMLESGLPLLGPHKARYEELKNSDINHTNNTKQE